MWRSSSKSSRQDETAAREIEAVAGVRDALARVIAGGSHDHRSRAIDAIQAIDRGWQDEEARYTVTFRLAKVLDARFGLLGSFSENTDELPPDAPTRMQTALYAIDHLGGVLLARMAAIGVAVYPTTGAPAGDMPELPRAQADTLLQAIEQDPG